MGGRGGGGRPGGGGTPAERQRGPYRLREEGGRAKTARRREDQLQLPLGGRAEGAASGGGGPSPAGA